MADQFKYDNAVIGLIVLVTLLTIPSLTKFTRFGWHVREVNHDETLYEDVDGIATKESMAAFSNKYQFIVIFVSTVSGLALSIANIVFTGAQVKSSSSGTPLVAISLLIPAWLFLLIQLIDTAREAHPVQRFKSAIWRMNSLLLILAMTILILVGDGARSSENRFRVTTILTSVQLGLSVAVMAAIFSIRRRPIVYHPKTGENIDQQYSVPLWSRYTFYWGVDILANAGKAKFDKKDLPSLDHIIRSEDATQEFKNIVLKDNLPLWLQIFWKYRNEITWQWASILFSNFFDVAPAFATLQLLKYLEERNNINDVDPTAWKYVAAIIAATVSSHFIDSRIMWLGGTTIVCKLRATLTGLMFEKMLRMKDSSEPPKDEEKQLDPEKKGKTRQDITTMFATDTNAIAIFGSQNTQYVNCAGKVIVTVVFLIFLIGWQSLCAGMIGIVVLFPINKELASRYGKKQKNLMEIRDRRNTLISEALQGIRQIKFSATEDQWTQKLEAIREEELTMLWRTRLNNLYMAIASEFTPILLTALSLATYSYIHGYLLPSVAFTSISLFLQLEGLVSHIPTLLVSAINAKVSCDRIEDFLKAPERSQNTYPGESVSFHNVSATFPHDSKDVKEDRFTLRDINLNFPNNALSVISGPTGSGKSLLLAAILGEAEVLGGYIHVPKAPSSEERFDSKATAADWILPTAIAFISQTPWIENATIKDNILFGLPLDPVRYEKVIHACALTQDLDIFEDGDQTEVGAQGISLSGGQKWRLTLARAFYSRAGILIMDDVFSALDAHVGKHIYDNAVMGELAEGRTRILVTHHVSLCLPRAKYAVRLSARGVMEHAGSIDELKEDGTLDEILKTDVTTEVEEIEEDDVLKKVKTNGSAVIPSVDAKVAAKAPPKKLVEEEKREVGGVKKSVYTGYLRATGGWIWVTLVVILFAVAEATLLGRNYWIKIWSSSFQDSEVQSRMAISHAAYRYEHGMQTKFFGQPLIPLNSTTGMKSANIGTNALPDVRNQSLWFYLGIYCLISTISVVFSVGRLYNIYDGSIRASRKIFQDMTRSVLHAPLRWLDTVPTGRILNRFSGDFTNLDSSLAQNFNYVAAVGWEILGILISAVFISPWMVLFAVVLLAACSLFATKYISAARNVKRLESTSKSPVISHFSAALSGLSTIRAFSKSSEFQTRMFALIDSYTICLFHNSLFRNWLMLRIGFTASLFSGIVAAFIISTPGIDASLAGFALSFALSFGHYVSFATMISTQVELDMNATERIFEYRDLEIENQDGEDVRASWPEEGKIEVNELDVGYAEGLPSILKGLTFTAEKNQRIGVVGRTGAGKSTLSLALFRFLQSRSGSITIDGVDISKVKLHTLRKRLAIIPQDPVLFSGTIRSNLDPFDQFSDFQLREALMRVHLIPSATNTPHPESEQGDSSSGSSTTVIEQGNTNIFKSLTTPIASGGTNLSQGQKQLLCLARAILSRPKILLLDEATSAVDMATDTLIQRSIREEFANTTLLVVAHRLSTVADFDKILVMKDGKNAEYASPKDLLDIEDGIFKSMIEQSGETEELERTIRSH